MVYRKATYEEYVKASSFAKFRYKFGVYIQIVALVLFILLFIYTVTNVEEMKANPKDYAEEKLGVTCTPKGAFQIQTDYGSNRNIKSDEDW